MKKFSYTYTQLNKDAAYWPEKIVAKQEILGGHTSGIFICTEEQKPIHSLLIDAGLGTIQALCESNFVWGSSLDVFITHGHPDHHLELMLLSEVHCRRLGPAGMPPINVYCTPPTFERFLRPVHGFRFSEGSNQTLKFCPVVPASVENASPDSLSIGPEGIFHVRTIESDHFPGAINYVVEFSADSGPQKVLIGWDLKTLPDPDLFGFLRNPTLALVEANTVLKSAEAGHASGEDLVASSFLSKLNCQVAESGPPHGIYLVHFGGRIDEASRQIIPDSEFLAQVAAKLVPMPSSVVGLAQRLQSWNF